MKLTKKQQEFVKDIYKDEDGIWCTLKDGYGWGADENKVIHCETYSELRAEMKYVAKIE